MVEILLTLTGPVALAIVLVDRHSRKKASPVRSLAGVDLPKNNWPF